MKQIRYTYNKGESFVVLAETELPISFSNLDIIDKPVNVWEKIPERVLIDFHTKPDGTVVTITKKEFICLLHGYLSFGNPIAAVRIVRNLTDTDLKDAKYFVDKLNTAIEKLLEGDVGILFSSGGTSKYLDMLVEELEHQGKN
jgi:hypothetical protein